jgi:hypothetical protein
LWECFNQILILLTIAFSKVSIARKDHKLIIDEREGLTYVSQGSDYEEGKKDATYHLEKGKIIYYYYFLSLSSWPALLGSVASVAVATYRNCRE